MFPLAVQARLFPEFTQGDSVSTPPEVKKRKRGKNERDEVNNVDYCIVDSGLTFVIVRCTPFNAP